MKNKNQTGLKNFKPKTNLNHNIYMDRFYEYLFWVLKVRSFLFCYIFNLIGKCWSKVSIPVLDFYVALGENIVCGF